MLSILNAWKKTNGKERFATLFYFLFVFFVILNSFFWNAPGEFENDTLVEIESGETLSEVSEKLKESNIIRSEFWFKIGVYFSDKTHGVKAGDYFFDEPQKVFTVSNRLAKGEYGLKPARVTIPEGLNVFQIADIFEERFDLFDKKDFIEMAPEGYLFPDTYFFLPNTRAEDVIERMKMNFEEKIKSVAGKINDSGKSLEEIIKVASIVEEEAITFEDRRKVSGIIWKRLSINMPLQVDATFIYVNGKNTYELTLEDLEIDSPYNSYRNTGLPPTPISNPGMESILAAIDPEETEYLYFLSDLAGNMYYAKDFEGHQVNRVNHLRR